MELKFENGSSIQSIDSGTNKRSIRGIEELQQRVNEFYNSDSVTIVKDKTVYILPVKDQPIKLVTNDISIKSDDDINFYATKKITFFELCSYCNLKTLTLCTKSLYIKRLGYGRQKEKYLMVNRQKNYTM
ncbi:hypothetical protein DW954_02870 [Clostridium sp. AM45-5]|nr:hypothetical protein [Clostridium sp. AM45-5]RHS68296.1 hypothetical protein DW954_02870 [Clostridium sp. AM45-5]